MDRTQNERGAIGGTSTLGGSSKRNINYGVMPEQITGKLNENPGAEFIVIQKVRQSEEPLVWASGDPAQTEDLFRQAYTSLAFKEPATT